MIWGRLILAAFAVSVCAGGWFLYRFLRTVGWREAWHSPFGRYLLIDRALLVLLFGVAIFNRFADDWAWWAAARSPAGALLVWANALQALMPYRLLVRAQREAKVPPQRPPSP